MIAEELAFINATCVDLYLEFHRPPYFAPQPDMRISRPVFDAVALHIGDLDQVADVVEAYAKVDEVVMAGSLWAQLDANLTPLLQDDAKIDAQGLQEVQTTLEEQRRRFLHEVAGVLDLTCNLVPSLRQTAHVYDGFELPKGLREVATSAQVMIRAVAEERAETAQPAATNESRAQFTTHHQEREAGRIEARGRLSLMLAVECAEINHICEEAYRTVLATPEATPHRTWGIPTPVFSSVTAQIGELDRAAEIVGMYGAVSAATRLGAAWSGMNPIDALFRSFRRGYFGKLGSVLDQTAALLPLLKATAHDANISTDRVLQAQSSVEVDRLVEIETEKPVVRPL